MLIEKKMRLLGSCWNPLTRMRGSRKKSLRAASRVECESRCRRVWIVGDGWSLGYREEEDDVATMTEVEFGTRCLVVRRLTGLELAGPHVYLPNIRAKKLGRGFGVDFNSVNLHKMTCIKQ